MPEHPGLHDGLQRVLSAAGASNPDGRPLYAYRCDADSFALLEDLLRSEVSDEGEFLPSPHRSAAFCIWASEWWRRCHDGGRWSWEDLLQRIGAHQFMPGQAGYMRLQQVVGSGILWWRRPLIVSPSGRAFLVTLACEGGLPLRLLQKEDTALHRYFKALLQDIHEFGVTGDGARACAEALANYLPKSLHHATVYQLSSDLVSEIWRLQQRFGKETATIAALDETTPGWRDRLPLRLDDAIACTLLGNLLVDAAEISRGRNLPLRLVRRLVPDEEGFRLSCEFSIPRSVETRPFFGCFGLSDSRSWPASADLCIVTPRGDVAHAAFVYPRDASSDRLAVEVLRDTPPTYDGSVAAGDFYALIRSRGLQRRSMDFPGLPGLSSLPWAFSARPASDGEDESVEFVGEGTITIPSAIGVVAVEDEHSVREESGSEIFQTSKLDTPQRTLYRFRGALIIQQDDAQVRIETDSFRPHSTEEYRLNGRTLILGTKQSVFHGHPALLIAYGDGGVVKPVGWEALQWRSLGAPAWQSATQRSFGDGYARFQDQGLVRWERRVTVLPPKFVIAYIAADRTTPAMIRLAGLAGARVELARELPTFACPAIEVAKDSAVLTFPQGMKSHPDQIVVRLIWDTGETTLPLAYPEVSVRLFDSRDEPVTNDSVLSLHRAAGVYVSISAPSSDGSASFDLAGDLKARDSCILESYHTGFQYGVPEVAPGRYEFELGAILKDVETLLRSSTDPEACVRLIITAVSQGVQRRQVVHLARYDRVLRLYQDEEEGSLVQVRLPGQAGEFDPVSGGRMSLEAHHLDEEHPKRLVLEAIGWGEWRLPQECLEGDWVLVAAESSSYQSVPFGLSERVRSCLADDTSRWYGSDGQGIPEFSALGRELLEQPNGSHWSLVWPFLRLPRRIAPVNVSLFAAITANPECAALGALLCPADLLRAYWSALEELPFWWLSVPLAAWEQATHRFVTSQIPTDEDLPESLREPLRKMAIEHVVQRVRALRKQSGLLDAVLPGALAQALGQRVPREQTILQTPEVREQFAAEVRTAKGEAKEIIGRLLSQGTYVSDLEPFVTCVSPLLPCSNIWFDLGTRPGEARFAVQNAPIVPALAAIYSVPLTPLQLYQLRRIQQLEPNWFESLYRSTLLFVLGEQRAQHVKRQLANANALL